MSQQDIIGWDVGGAHLKAVLINAQGQVLHAKQVYCPLWRGLTSWNQQLMLFCLKCRLSRIW